ncbi:DUF2513 domain-containing protein [Gemella sp. 27098_8_149]|uniref:DUF2513 domain-containing protein n=1 Tax=Gemella sp. 27098_8_149 TaxID=3003689 RepID=UPI00352E8A0E
MKVNIDLCRLILLKIEESSGCEIFDMEIENYNLEEIAYNSKRLEDENLITHTTIKYSEGKIYIFNVGGLTLEGQKFLNKIRDEKFFRKIKNEFVRIGKSITLEAFKNIVLNKLYSYGEDIIQHYDYF